MVIFKLIDRGTCIDDNAFDIRRSLVSEDSLNLAIPDLEPSSVRQPYFSDLDLGD